MCPRWVKVFLMDREFLNVINSLWLSLVFTAFRGAFRVLNTSTPSDEFNLSLSHKLHLLYFCLLDSDCETRHKLLFNGGRRSWPMRSLRITQQR